MDAGGLAIETGTASGKLAGLGEERLEELGGNARNKPDSFTV
jgi:hypothetical protein